MSNLNSSGENADRSANEDDGEIFAEADCQSGHQRFYRNQIGDTYGKEDVDEKLVAKITGAKEVLKKPRRDRFGILGDHADANELNIMDLLQLFRENHEHRGGARREHARDPIQQLIMAAAQSGHDNDFSGDEIDNENHFGEENDDNPLSNPFSLMRVSNNNNGPALRDREQQRPLHGPGGLGRPNFAAIRRAERPDQFAVGSSSSSVSGGPNNRARNPMVGQQQVRIAEMEEDDDDMADFQSELDEGNVHRDNNRPQAQPGLSSLHGSNRGGGQLSFGEQRGPGTNNFAGGRPSLGGSRQRENDNMESFGQFLVMPRSRGNNAPSGGNGREEAQRSVFDRPIQVAFRPGGGESGSLRIARAAENHRPQRVRADPDMIKTLMEMGFTKSQCKAALKQNKNNLERCIDKLLTNGDQFIGLENSDESDDGVDHNQR